MGFVKTGRLVSMQKRQRAKALRTESRFAILLASAYEMAVDLNCEP